MKKCLSFLLLCLCVVSAAMASDTAHTDFICEDNILTNNGLENGLQGWTIASGTVALTTDARTGSQALSLQAAGAEEAWVVRTARMTDARDYALFFYSKKLSAVEEGRTSISINFFNAQFQRIGVGGFTNLGLDSTYILYDLVGSGAPENAVFVGFEIRSSSETPVLFDDFCLVPELESENCRLSLTVSNVTCDDNKTPDNQLDDRFTFDYVVNGENASLIGYDLRYLTGFNFSLQEIERSRYGQSRTSELIRIGDEPLEVVVFDRINRNCSMTFEVMPPAACSAAGSCEITDLQVTVGACKDNGTSDPDDDTFDLTILASGINTGSGWSSDLRRRTLQFQGNYNEPFVLEDIPIVGSGSISELAIRDLDSAFCNARQAIEVPLVCSIGAENTCPGNLLANGNFEQPLTDNWVINEDAQDFVRTGAESFDGSNAIEVCTQFDSPFNTIYQDIPLAGNPKAFELSWDGLFEDLGMPDINLRASAFVRASFRDANDEFIIAEPINSDVGRRWSRNSHVIEPIPVQAATMRIELGAAGGGDFGFGCATFDNVCLRRLGAIDLALAMEAAVFPFSQYTQNSVTLTLKNEGEETATGIEIALDLSDKTQAVLVGNFTPIASAGTFKPVPNIWTIDTLRPLEEATLEIQYFPLVENYLPYAQVTKADQQDLDSTPNNGNCCTPNEDDEATLLSATPFLSVPSSPLLATVLSEFNIFPNPASDEITVTLANSVIEQQTIQIRDQFGKLVWETQIAPFHTTAKVAVADFAEGIYFLAMQSGKKIRTKKFVVVKRW